MQLAETELAVGDEWTHAEGLGEHERLAVVGLAALGIEEVGMRRDVAEQVHRMGNIPTLSRIGLHGAVAQTLCLVKPTEQ